MGYFLWQGVKDPLGGINSLWPLFGIANQLLGHRCVVRCDHHPPHRWVGVLCSSHIGALVGAGGGHVHSVLAQDFDPNPRIGFLAHARQLASQMATAPKPGDLVRFMLNDRLMQRSQPF